MVTWKCKVLSLLPDRKADRSSDRLCNSPNIMIRARLHCQMDVSIETPCLSTARGGKSKRVIIACI